MSRVFASVRARATLGATLVVAVALAAAGAAVLFSLYANLTNQAGTEAERAAREVAADLSGGLPYRELRLDDEGTPTQVLAEDGTLVAASEGLERISGTATDQVQPRPEPTPAPSPTGDDDDDDDGGGSGDGSGDDDGGDSGVLGPGEISDEAPRSNGSATIDGQSGDYRFAEVEVAVPGQGTFTVFAGAPLAAEQNAVETALKVMLIGFPLLLGIVAGVTWLVTRRALRPVEGIRREMAEITASADLTRRVPEPETHDEIARLASTTNETLAALEASVERQRRFVADASHELRSPIASLRTQLEVGEAHPELLDVPGAVQDTVRLQHLAADLLLLARLDAGEKPLDGRVELAALVGEAAAGREGVRVVAATAGGSAVETAEGAGGDPVGGAEGDSVGGPVEVAGSRGQLERVLGNLLDNGRRHARSEVTVSVRRDGDQAVVEVADDGDGVPEADRERIFERFVRLDDARSRDDGGAGLGLAIARDVAVRHGGTLTVGTGPAGGARFTLRLPLAG
ncbi:HAMP domain-containing sensor histidine kinase [Streptomyces sp. NPDC093252]|uniref:sensor histidine kinase n=1 Tax=Streptomyces sp. NPDC093252 TaxID=3154980 RepID=UPI003443072D